MCDKTIEVQDSRIAELEEELTSLYKVAHCEHGIRFLDEDCSVCMEEHTAMIAGMIRIFGSKERLLAVLRGEDKGESDE